MTVPGGIPIREAREVFVDEGREEIAAEVTGEEADEDEYGESPSHLPFAPSSELPDTTTVDPSYIISLMRKLLPSNIGTQKQTQNAICSLYPVETSKVCPLEENIKGESKYPMKLVDKEANNNSTPNSIINDRCEGSVNDQFVDQTYSSTSIYNGMRFDSKNEDTGSDDRKTRFIDEENVWEDSGCILWDLSASRAHAEFMVNNFMLEVLLASLNASESPRITFWMEIIDEGIWTEKNEQVFIQLMEIEVINGNRQTTTFSPGGWGRISKGMEAATNRKYKHDQLKNKFNSLRARWRDFSSILKESGMGYIAATGQVNASEDVWAKLYKVNRNARSFRKKGCPMYESLCRIYGDTTATGSMQHPSTKLPSDSEDEAVEISGVKSVDRNMDKAKTQEVLSPMRRPAKRVKKQNVSSILTSTLKVLSESSKRRTDMLEKRLEISAGSSTPPTDALQTKCMDILNSIANVDDEIYLHAVDRFHQDPMWMQFFLQMPEGRRLAWLARLAK